MSNHASDNVGSIHDPLAGQESSAVSSAADTALAPGRAEDDGDTRCSGSTKDNEATWDPGRTDPLGHGRSSGTRPAESEGLSEASPDVGETFVPGRTRRVKDLWGDDFDDVTPGHTLRAPGDDRLTSCLMVTSADVGLPDLSDEGYDLLDVLGEGGVGIVYQAVQKSVDRTIAVKMIKPGLGRDAQEQANFISEAVVMGKLDHPSIVPIHDLNTTVDGRPFYSMKLVRGTPWSRVIGDKSLTENLRIFLTVCDAVSFAHSKAFVHRDLKPDNVMLGEFGEVQVMDWGLGASVDENGELIDLSGAQAAGGTPSYMAPEMVTGEDGAVGTHSDVYLLGGILHAMVTKEPPHGGRRVLDTLENARANVIQPTECTGALFDIAMKALQTEAGDRYASVNALKEALLDYESHVESIELCRRAIDDLSRARQDEDYERFAQALFGFREAVTLWEDNADAEAGVLDAQLQYARCAFEKGDLDLAASTLERDCVPHQDLATEIGRAQHRREAAKHRLKRFRTTVVALTVAIIVTLMATSVWIYNAKQVAENAKIKAQHEEARATQALADLEKAYADVVTAQEEERRARAETIASQEQERKAQAKAKASDQVATKAQDDLAKAGMLLDNTRWVLDAEAARQVQADAATSIGKPAELTIALSDDVDLTLMLIPPGELVMGSPPEEENRSADEHLHRVHHRQAFYLGKLELTEAQWQAATGQPPACAANRAADPLLPVVGVSRDQIGRDLLPALQKHAPDGYAFRLPSEAEWEYACRAGTATAYHAGDDEQALDSVGWFGSNSGRKVHQVGEKSANAFGLHDMHGNVNEVCVDEYATAFYLTSPTEDPISAREGEFPVVRGGSAHNIPEHCRSAYRSYIYRKNEYPFVGLRLALVPIRSIPATTKPARVDTELVDP